jgi:hypothetical protein
MKILFILWNVISILCIFIGIFIAFGKTAKNTLYHKLRIPNWI